MKKSLYSTSTPYQKVVSSKFHHFFVMSLYVKLENDKHANLRMTNMQT